MRGTLSDLVLDYKAVLEDKLSASTAGPIPVVTPGRVVGKHMFPGKATVVIGMRRAGKTSFLHQLRAERAAAGTPIRYLPYVNTEDDRLAGMQLSGLSDMVESYYRIHPEIRNGDVPVLWCLDEIQSVPGWESFVRRMLDTENVQMVLTGSSAALLSREIATALRGRAWALTLHPFGFDEVLRHSGAELPSDVDAVGPRSRSRLESDFMAYLECGGFPETQGLDRPTRWQLLRDYVDIAILRDVVERHNVTSVSALRWMVRHLLGNAGGAFSVEKFHAVLKSLGLSVARDTLHEMFSYLVDCFMVRSVWMESDSERQKMVNPRKVYPVDPGLIPVFDRTRRSNIGHALETTVLIELERRRAEVTWVRTPSGFEVDFLARFPDGSSELIQVCADISAPDTFAREFRALSEASTRFPDASARLLIAFSPASPIPSPPPGITVDPVWKWILRDAPKRQAAFNPG